MSQFARFGAILVAMGVLLMLPLQRSEASTTMVNVGTYWFCNSSFTNGTCPTTIAVGDTVQWSFTDAFGHTTTECGASCDTPTGSPLWDSGIRTSGSFSHTFSSPGVFKYQCSVHTTLMRGQVTVTGASVVGGIAELPSATGSNVIEPATSSNHFGLIAGFIAMAAGAVTLAGAAWYPRRSRAAEVE
jgi:plastocyanin